MKHVPLYEKCYTNTYIAPYQRTGNFRPNINIPIYLYMYISMHV